MHLGVQKVTHFGTLFEGVFIEKSAYIGIEKGVAKGWSDPALGVQNPLASLPITTLPKSVIFGV